MQSNWKERFASCFTANIYQKIHFGESGEFVREEVVDEEIEAFIETEIIEKLIEDVPTDWPSKVEAFPKLAPKWIKEQLRAKWLGKDSNEN